MKNNLKGILRGMRCFLMLSMMFGYLKVNAQQDKDISRNSYANETEITAPGSITLKDGFYIPAGKTVWIHTTGLSFKNCVPFVGTPSVNQNYVGTKIFRVAGVLTDADVNAGGRTTCEVNQIVQYFDGIGRPTQNILIQGSPTGKDLITPIAYDAFGRESIKYQPYAQPTNGGQYRPLALSEQAGFYNTPSAGITPTPNPFAVTVFEFSLLNRVIERGATGADWQPLVNSDNGHTLKIVYSTNIADEVKLWKIDTTTNAGATATVYQPGSLSKIIKKDENWKIGNGKAGTSEEFQDSRGRGVLKRVWETDSKSLSTYYVYDNLGNLRYVLPSAVNENGLNINSFTEGDTNFDNYIYGYHYDYRKRIVEKKIPGKGWEFMIYNKRDQLVLSQDTNQRSKSPKEWLFIKYDALGRVVVTGLYNNNGTRDALQATVDSQAILWESRATTDMGYSNASFPQTVAYYHSIYFYDDYDFPGNRFGGPNGTTQVTSARTKALLTGTKITTLGTSSMLLTVPYYDEEGRVVQSKSENHLGGTEVVDNTYNFASELTASTRVHTSSAAGTTTIANTYMYDHVGRKLATRESINGQPEVVLSKLEYNELGQLFNKNLHSNDGGNSFLQNTSYAYNERGWLKNITSGQFSMQLKYNDGGTPQYNGNIAGQLWGPGSNASVNTFSYSYDKLNRLTGAAANNLGEAITYDEMGNIKSLARDGFGTNNYTAYTGNKLTQISGFTNSNYGYDGNGNLISDSQKNINLSYNYLNLPQSITGSQNLSYLYDASGRKLKKISGGVTTDYLGGIQYTNGKIDFIQTEEGIARNNNGTYSYEYILSDHLGNNRTMFYQNPNTKQLEVLQRDDYYAFGLRKSTIAASNDNKYLYNGKELQQELGQYDYGFRLYDPVIARWNVMDPLSENHYDTNPYHYVLNNPTRYMDYLGLDTTYKQDNMTGADWRNYKPGADGIDLNNVTITGQRTNSGWAGFGGGFDISWGGFSDFGSGRFMMRAFSPPPVLTSSSGPFTQLDNRGSQKELTHAEELAEYGQISWGYNFAAGVSAGPLGGSAEMGTLITNKGWARDYKTIYYAPGFTSPSISHSFFLVYSTFSANLPTFSDWNGFSKGVSGSFGYIAFGGGLGSNYTVRSLGLSLAPESLNFMKESRGSGALNVGVTFWMGSPYRIPGQGSTERYINTMKFQGGY